MSDPVGKLRLLVGVVVTVVWAVTFGALVFRPSQDAEGLLSVNAVMLIVAGALYADRIRRKNGGDGGSS